jgi:prepilin-type N-terminal cleavage/methylation domain-containing protein
MIVSPRPKARPESGFSLIELLMTMTVMVIIMTGVMVSMNGWVVNSERRVTNLSQASSAIEEAFMTLDGEVRYAADIGTPAESMTSPYTGVYWVEFESDWTVSSQGSAKCTQLEYNTTAGALQQRTWLVNGTAPTGATPPATGWQVLASGLSTAPASNPFSMSETQPNLLNPSTPSTTTTVPPSTTTTTVAQDVAATPWQLTITLSSAQGQGSQSETAQSSFTISALDVTSSSTATNVCGGNPT